MGQHEVGTKQDLAVYRLENAENDLKSAKILFDTGDFRGANNRAYYGIFNSINAVLAIEGIGFKRHKDVLAYFNKNYVNTEVFPKELGHQIAKAALIRNKSDYDDFYIASKQDSDNLISTARELISLVKQYVDEDRI